MNRVLFLLIGPCVAALVAGSVLMLSWVRDRRTGALAPAEALVVAIACYAVAVLCLIGMLESCRRSRAQVRYEEVEDEMETPA